MAKQIRLKSTGQIITIFNPEERSEKYCEDLKYGFDTVSGKKLTKNQKAWRSGYLKARKDNASAYKAKQRSKAYFDKKRSLEKVFGV